MAENSPGSPDRGNRYTILFMVVLSLVCALILSTLAAVLKEPQQIAKELDRSRQMLIAARIMNPEGYFQVSEESGKYTPAKAETGGILKPASEVLVPDREQILEVYRARIRPFLVDDRGEETSFEKEKIDEKKYVSEYRTTGYYKEPFKLVYKIFSNPTGSKKAEGSSDRIEGYVFPVNGMGLWDAIYGFLAVKPDGDTVIGISWYDQKETPGLGANISEAGWQSQFPGKLLFQESGTGQTDFKTAPLGIVVVKGKVSEVLGDSPKALSAVDGMAGATLTGNGVTNAYRDVLAAYRPFLLRLHDRFAEKPQ